MKLPETKFLVKPEWLDYNGHMNVAYYVMAFDMATDFVYEDWAIGADYLKTGFSVYTLGLNVDYLSEMFEGDEAIVTTQLVDADHKRIHYFHKMYRATTRELVATNECLCMNVSLENKRSAPFSAELQTRFQTILEAHNQFGVPDGFGRTLKIRRK